MAEAGTIIMFKRHFGRYLDRKSVERWGPKQKISVDRPRLHGQIGLELSFCIQYILNIDKLHENIPARTLHEA